MLRSTHRFKPSLESLENRMMLTCDAGLFSAVEVGGNSSSYANYASPFNDDNSSTRTADNPLPNTNPSTAQSTSTVRGAQSNSSITVESEITSSSISLSANDQLQTRFGSEKEVTEEITLLFFPIRRTGTNTAWANNLVKLNAAICVEEETSIDIDFNASEVFEGLDGTTDISVRIESVNLAEGSTFETYTADEFKLGRDGEFEFKQTVELPTGEFSLSLSILRSLPSNTRGFDSTQTTSGEFDLSISAGKPDLVATFFEYWVPEDDTKERNGPLATNQGFRYLLRVENAGDSPSPESMAKLYVSKDSEIDPDGDELLHTIDIPSLLAGESQTIAPASEILVTLPELVQQSWHGWVFLGVVLDPDEEIDEATEDNNDNQGIEVDIRPMQLYDPVGPLSTPLEDVIRRDAVLWLHQNGFVPLGWRSEDRQEGDPGLRPTRLLGSGWQKPLNSGLRIRSPFDGRIRNGHAYRQNAFIKQKSGTDPASYFILLQGSEVTAEPSPATVIPQLSLLWAVYVKDWHDRY